MRNSLLTTVLALAACGAPTSPATPEDAGVALDSSRGVETWRVQSVVTGALTDDTRSAAAALTVDSLRVFVMVNGADDRTIGVAVGPCYLKLPAGNGAVSTAMLSASENALSRCNFAIPRSLSWLDGATASQAPLSPSIYRSIEARIVIVEYPGAPQITLTARYTLLR